MQPLENRYKELANTRGWIGVDFDGTLAFYDGWTGWNRFGPPIPKMVDRIRLWLAYGIQVRILTARVTFHDNDPPETCRVTGEKWTNAMMRFEIAGYCEKHVGARLPVTCVKDMNMVELWDDRAVGVVANTGETLVEAALAEQVALAGKAFQK